MSTNSIKATVLNAINTRLDTVSASKAFAISAETMALLATDPIRGSDAIKAERAAYDEANGGNPLRPVVFAAMSAALSQIDDEDEAKSIANSVRDFWQQSKGLRILTGGQLNRALKNEQDAEDLPLPEIQAIAKAWYSKDEEGAKLNTVPKILAHFKLAKTATAVFSNCQLELTKLAKVETTKAEPVKPVIATKATSKALATK